MDSESAKRCEELQVQARKIQDLQRHEAYGLMLNQLRIEVERVRQASMTAKNEFEFMRAAFTRTGLEAALTVVDRMLQATVMELEQLKSGEMV